MKKSYLILLAFSSLLVTFLLWGCGDGPGAPGSSGSEKTGIRIAAVYIDCCPSGACEPCRDVDVQLSDGTRPGRTPVSMLIEAYKLNPTSTFDPFPASVEKCRITYKKAIEDPSSPTLESLTIFPNCTIGGCTGTCPDECIVTLIDDKRKRDYLEALQGGINIPAEYPTHYVAIYNCEYVNNFDKKGSFQTEFDFWLADFVDR